MSKDSIGVQVENSINSGNPLPSSKHCYKELIVLHLDTKGQSADNGPPNFGNFLCVLTQIHVGGLISDPDFPSARRNCRSTSVHMVQVRDDRGSMGSTNGEEVEDKYEQSLDFCGSALSVVMSSILTACELRRHCSPRLSLHLLLMYCPTSRKTPRRSSSASSLSRPPKVWPSIYPNRARRHTPWR